MPLKFCTVFSGAGAIAPISWLVPNTHHVYEEILGHLWQQGNIIFLLLPILSTPIFSTENIMGHFIIKIWKPMTFDWPKTHHVGNDKKLYVCNKHVLSTFCESFSFYTESLHLDRNINYGQYIPCRKTDSIEWKKLLTNTGNWKSE
jgi:hypothetical protein